MKTAYIIHLLGWGLPVIALQWLAGWRILRRNLAVVVQATLAGGTFFSVTDSWAVRSGIWHFDENQILGLRLGPLPLEEVLFFFLTSLLVVQSLVLFLPERFRR